MAGNFDLKDYVEVADRIAEFRKKHPEGSFQSRIIDVPVPFMDKFLAVEATAYRTADDERPGVGLAWEPVPGKTPYTRDSELQNAQTAAIGRAIVAVLAADTKRGIASADEVRAREIPAGGSVTGKDVTPSRSNQSPSLATGGSVEEPPPPRTASPTNSSAESPSSNGGPPSEEQWKRAFDIIGPKPKVVKAANTKFKVSKAEDITADQLADLIKERAGVA